MRLINEHKLNDAWNLHEQHMNMEGILEKSIARNFLATFALSIELKWLNTAYDKVPKVLNEHKQYLLERDTLIYLSLFTMSCKL